MGFISYEGWEPKHLSFSTLNSWRMCGRMTLFQKVMGLEQHPGLAAIGGNAVHEATQVVDEMIYAQGFGALSTTPAASEDVDTNSSLGEAPF